MLTQYLCRWNTTYITTTGVRWCQTTFVFANFTAQLRTVPADDRHLYVIYIYSIVCDVFFCFFDCKLRAHCVPSFFS